MSDSPLAEEVLAGLKERHPRYHEKAYLFVLAALQSVLERLPDGSLGEVAILLDNAAAASQAVGPPLSEDRLGKFFHQPAYLVPEGLLIFGCDQGLTALPERLAGQGHFDYFPGPLIGPAQSVAQALTLVGEVPGQEACYHIHAFIDRFDAECMTGAIDQRS